MLITPDPKAPQFKKEKINSPTDYWQPPTASKLLTPSQMGKTQRGLQERYQVKAKQLAACITGRKYLGGTERKRKRSGSDEGATSSKSLPSVIKM